MGGLRLPYSHQKLRSMTPRVASVQKLKGIFPKKFTFLKKKCRKGAPRNFTKFTGK